LKVARLAESRETTTRKGHSAMTMTDPIADMLTRLRNANQAYHDAVSMPYSKLKQGVAEILQQEGYITKYEVADPAEGQVGKTLTITLKYGRNRERSIAGVRRISKPGLRVYAKHTGLPKVLGGLGVAIISTSQGLRTDRQGNQKGVGGEVFASVWSAETERGAEEHVAYWQASCPGPGRCRCHHRRSGRDGQGPQGHAVPHRGRADHGGAKRR